MNRRILTAFLAALVLFVAGCSHHHKQPISILVVVPAVPDLMPNASTSITAAVTGDPANAGVNWTCAPADSCGTFNPTTSTGASATTVYTAPATVGAVTITATSVTDPTIIISTNTDISTAPGINGAFAFYVSGNEGTGNYSLAGAATVDNFGNVTGEQDFNDGVTTTSVLGGIGDVFDSAPATFLTVDPTTGEGTLTIATTGGARPGEILGVQFVSPSHALITEFDGNGTSSGSLDLQTATAIPAGSFSFVFSGYGTGNEPIVAGGIFTNTPITGASTSNIAGKVDINDAGTPVTGTAFTATTTAPDSFGRGTIVEATGPGNFPVQLTYYVVGPEAIRIIDTDFENADFAVGSAFGQGTTAGTFSNASLGPSVLSVSGTPMFIPEVLLGQIVPTPDGGDTTMGSIAGVADLDEVDMLTGSVPASPITGGTYTINLDGSGNVTGMTGAGDYTTLGIYLVDPALNVNDPNNTGTDLGGALVADMDTATVMGSGVLVPQADPSPSDLVGNYAFGAQYVDNGPDEADFVGNGTLTPSDPTAPPITVAFAGADSLNDPNGVFSGATPPVAPTTGVTFGGTFDDDGTGVGRSTMAAPGLTVTVGTNTVELATVVSYQASPTQVFWMENDTNQTFSGQLQQQQALPIMTPITDAQRTAKAKKTQKH